MCKYGDSDAIPNEGTLENEWAEKFGLREPLKYELASQPVTVLWEILSSEDRLDYTS